MGFHQQWLREPSLSSLVRIQTILSSTRSASASIFEFACRTNSLWPGVALSQSPAKSKTVYYVKKENVTNNQPKKNAFSTGDTADRTLACG